VMRTVVFAGTSSTLDLRVSSYNCVHATTA
jgi:hypothetical protein